MFNPLVSFKSLEGHEGEVKCLTFSQDGQFLASGDNELTVIVWDWQKNQKFSLQGHEKNHSKKTEILLFLKSLLPTLFEKRWRDF